MDLINTIIGIPLGYLLWVCYTIFSDYGIAIIVFTLLTKIITFPISLMVQKNSVKMIKMKPKLEALRFRYSEDKDKYYDEQAKLYKAEKYSPMAGVWPLLIQIPIILGLINVVYNPLTHLIRISKDTIALLISKAEIFAAEGLGSAPQLKILEMIQNSEFVSQFNGAGIEESISSIQSVKTDFLGIDMAAVPQIGTINILFLVPVLAGISALLLCYVQNKINVLQLEQGKMNQWGMSIFMIAFSVYFSFIVPAAVGIYWIAGNLLSIAVMYLVNIIYNPKKHIDYEELSKIKEELLKEAEEKHKYKARAKSDYKRFCKANIEGIDVIFYSEKSGFYKYFSNTIDSLLTRSDSLIIHYVTSDPEDAIFQKNNSRIVSYFVDQPRLIALMMKVEASVVVMTTPDLEKYYIKRSKIRKDVEYIYMDHACVSLNLTYRTGAFDYFDTMFVTSQTQADEIRAMEIQRNKPKKRIVYTGYGLIDNMIADYQAMPKTESKEKTVLIAPSWQEDNILDSCLDNIIESLWGKGYKLIVRPHPQYIKRFPVQMKEIINKYEDRLGENFQIQTDFSSNSTVYTADLIISDWSCIVFEYAFTTNKPTLLVNTKMKIINPDYEKIDIEPVDIGLRNIVGKTIEKEETANIYETVKELMDSQADYEEHIEKYKNEYFFNLGKSGDVGAKYILDRVKK